MASEGTFNELIHAPLRLRICGLLRSIDRLDYAVLRDSLEVSDPTLSKALKMLSDAGFVAIKKSPSPLRADSRRITWLALTAAGRQAFDEHVQALQGIAAGLVASPGRPGR